MPLHIGTHWSVLDITILLEIDCTNDYVKETGYIKQHNENVSDFNATNKVTPPMWWAKYFGLYTKEKNGVSHYNICSGSDDMTLCKNK